MIRFRLLDGSTHGVAGFIAEYLGAFTALHVMSVRELRRGATVLHIHNPPDIFFPAGAIYRAAGRKVIFDHHDLFPETIAVKLRSRPAARLATWCQRATYAVANHVIATNDSYAALARASGCKDENQVTIVRNGPPAAWTRIAVHRREGPLEEVHLMYLGAISRQDGVDGLAPILASLRDRPDAIAARLTIVGDGDGRPGVAAALDDHHVADRVTFTGRVAVDRVPALIAAADVCVDPAPRTDVNDRSTMTKIADISPLACRSSPTT